MLRSGDGGFGKAEFVLPRINEPLRGSWMGWLSLAASRAFKVCSYWTKSGIAQSLME